MAYALAWCLLAPRLVVAQGGLPPFRVEHWTMDQGLPSNSVRDVVQDRDGYLWVSTWDGLARFDGIRFTVFNTTNTPAFTTNRLLHLIVARDGTLWITTFDGGVVAYRKGRFTAYGEAQGLPRAAVYTVYEDRKGTIWVGSQLTGAFRLVNGRFVPLAVPGAPRAETVTAIFEDSRGRLWLGSHAGLYCYEEGRIVHYPNTGDLSYAYVRQIVEDPEGRVWIGVAHALLRYDEHGRFTRFTLRDEPRPPRVVDALHVDREGVLWVGADPTEEGRVLRATGTGFGRFAGERFEPVDALAGSRIVSIFEDAEGSLWLADWSEGLFQLKESPFTTFGTHFAAGINTFYETRSGGLLIGTNGDGTHRYAHGRLSRLTGPGPALHDFVTALHEDRAGALWVGYFKPGLLDRFQGTTRRTFTTADGFPPAAARAIHEDAGGRIWVGTNAGLAVYEDGRFRTYTTREGLSHDWVRCIVERRGGGLWLCTNGGGLARYQDGRFTALTMADGLSSNRVRAVLEDPDGTLWIATEGRGLNRLKDGRVTVYTEADGLFDNLLHELVDDGAGRLWMLGNRGAFWVLRRDLDAFAEGRIRRITCVWYGKPDGYPGPEVVSESQHAALRTRDGRIWFGTIDGAAVVDPNHMASNPLPPPVVVERVLVDGTAVEASGPVRLELDHRDFAVEYTGLSFVAPGQVRFRYRLEGLEAGWVDAGTRRTAFYTHVPPGRHVFRVVAANEDGVWNETGASLEIVVPPFFYETGWFRLLCLVAFVAAVAGGLHWRLRLARARQLVLEEQVAARTRELTEEKQKTEAQAVRLLELDRMKSQLFANISHEFRTPLTLLIGPLEQALAGLHDADPVRMREQHALMLRNARRLLRLINQILELARLEAGHLHLDARPHDLLPLVEGAVLAFVPLAETLGLALRLECRCVACPVAVDLDKMEKVLANLLSNALKFTPRGGCVSVVLATEERQAVLSVADTGIGIDAAHLPRVFDRFYQVDASSTRRYEGSGIGLALVKELVELHGGTVGVESSPGAGTVFTIRLPLTDAASTTSSGDGAPGAEGDRPVPGSARDLEAALFVPRDAADPGVDVAADPEDVTTILVVDDNADIRRYVRSVLQPGYRVIEAADGAAGLAAARTALPDLVLADVMMPELDGLALSRAIRSEPSTDCIPVVLLTGRAGAEDHVAGLDAGADTYLTKPFDPDVLRACVRGLIDGRRHLRARLSAHPPVSPPAGVPVPSGEGQPPPSPFVGRIRAAIAEHLSDPTFSVEALAAHVALSRTQLYRRLQEEAGVGPNELIRTLRLERAAALLAERAGDVSEIAYAVGFNSLSYFDRCFRAHYGCAPSAYRRA